MIRTSSRILILSPHTDDGEISAGGTIARLAHEGWEIFYLCFSSCEKSLGPCDSRDALKDECRKATSILGIPRKNVTLLEFEVREFPSRRQEILDTMISFGREIAPEHVIAPSSFDTHQDHHVIYEESLRAFKKNGTIWGMEHPWNNITFRTDIFVPLEKEHIDRKIEALQCYSSQSFKDYFREDYIRANALTRGMNIGRKYAEVFECIRMVI
jgi:N-acetylglucosamine malate deacetylase 1